MLELLGFILRRCCKVVYRKPKVGNPIASILKSNVWRIPALVGLNPVSNFMGFTVGSLGFYRVLLRVLLAIEGRKRGLGSQGLGSKV